MLFDDALTSYLNYIENVRRFSPKTIKQKRIYIGYLARYAASQGITEVEQLTNILIDQHHAEMKATTNRRGSLNTVGTINTSIGIIKVFFSWCKNYAGIDCSVRPSDIIAMKTQDQRKTHLTFYLIKEVVEACEVRQDALMISLASKRLIHP